MEKQEKLTSENLQFINKNLANYDLAFKIIPAFLAVMFLFITFGTGEGFMSITALIAGIALSGFYVLAHWLLNKEREKIQIDIKNGIKEIIEGIIAKKIQRKKSMIFRINEVEYAVEQPYFDKFEQKDYVKIEILPTSKLVISIIKIEK